jgi:hypothetical protein
LQSVIVYQLGIAGLDSSSRLNVTNSTGNAVGHRLTFDELCVSTEVAQY